MSTQHPQDRRSSHRSEPFVGVENQGEHHDHLSRHQTPTGEPKPAGRWGHHLVMLICCIPMLVLVLVLVASGTAGSGAIVFAILCVGMMAAMMFMMPGDHRH